jgi:hypothetical protein
MMAQLNDQDRAGFNGPRERVSGVILCSSSRIRVPILGDQTD